MTTTRVFVPPIKIQGIKTKLVPLIREIVRLDPLTTWIEPFMGSGVVGFNVTPKRAVFADTNPHVIAFYRAIQAGEITASRVRAFLEAEGGKLREKDDLHYYAVRERFNRHHYPLDFLFLNRSCFNGLMRFNRKGDYNVPYGHKPERFAKAYVTKVVNQVAHVEDLLRANDWRFVEQSFEETLASAPGNAFVYCDPPYIGRHVDYYGSRDEGKERKLRDALMRFGGRFVLSTRDRNAWRANEYADTLWGDCFTTTKAHFYHVGAREQNRGTVVETLLTSYDPHVWEKRPAE